MKIHRPPTYLETRTQIPMSPFFCLFSSSFPAGFSYQLQWAEKCGPASPGGKDTCSDLLLMGQGDGYCLLLHTECLSGVCGDSDTCQRWDRSTRCMQKSALLLYPSLGEVLLCKQHKGHSPLIPYLDFNLFRGLQKVRHSRVRTLIHYKKQ